MKPLLSLIACICYFTTVAQYTISGMVKNEKGERLALASVFMVNNTSICTVTDDDGNYTLTDLQPGNYTLKCTYVGFRSRTIDIDLQSDIRLDLLLEGSLYGLDSIEIIANRVNDDPVFSYSTMRKEDIEVQNLGKDMPYVLAMSPSVVVTSDAGTGIGYTGIRVRGTDPSRVNVTINGVGLNEAESQGVFWVNLPDFASSVENIELQRGVGPSTNGAGAFGATLSLNTLSTHINPSVMVDATLGAYDTQKLTVGLSSGLINERYAVDLRYSKISSDGYVDRAAADLKSYYISATRITDKSSLRFITFSGDERTYQSWYGVPEAKINGDDEALLNHYYNNLGTIYSGNVLDSINLFGSDRRYNLYTYEDQVDDYGQDHYQLHYSRQMSDQWTSKWTAHYTKGQGFFEEYKYGEELVFYGIDPIDIDGSEISETDIVRRRWLDNHYTGLIWNNDISLSAATSLQFGVAGSIYLGDHFGNVVDYPLIDEAPDFDRKYYFSDATKSDANTYVRADHRLTDKIKLFGDLQYRGLHYESIGTDNDQQAIDIDESYHFLNPKLGLHYQLTDQAETYASFAVANREPDRSDFIDHPLGNRPRHETLYDTEIGYRYAHERYAFTANVYYMKYKDQLVLNGQLNDVGATLRTNVPDSYRLGVETVLGMMISEDLDWQANLTLSTNKVQSFTETIYDYTDGFEVIENVYEDTDLAYSPSIVSSSILTYRLPVQGLSAMLNTKYVGQQYLDNTSNEDRTIPSYFVNDLGVSYGQRWKSADISFQMMVYNVLNERYVSNGYTYSYIFGEFITENFYYPQAERHLMARMKVVF